MLKIVEQAYLESLLLTENINSTAILYLIKCKYSSPNASLLDLSLKHQLLDSRTAKKLLDGAEAAVQAAGSNAFSFSKGALIGPWEIGESRGAGLGGSHFMALHESTQQSALLRLIEPGFETDSTRINRLQERANAGAEPPHSSILKIDEIGEDFGWLYTVTHNVDGWNLASRLAQGILQETEALPLMRTVAEALRVAHGFHVAHAGLTPLGLLMNQDGNLFVTDFGVGSVHLDGPSFGQRPGTRLGSLLYAAPEVINGKAADGIDPRADLFSLGSIIYDAVLTPTSPANSKPNYPFAFTPPLSEPFKIVLSRCIAPQLDQRYPNVEALIADLDRIMAGTTPATLQPPPPSPPFKAPRADTAAPQQSTTAKVVLKEQKGSESDEELFQRSQAGADFLQAVLAGAPPPEVPDGYQKDLFNSEDQENSPPPPPKKTQASTPHKTTSNEKERVTLPKVPKKPTRKFGDKKGKGKAVGKSSSSSDRKKNTIPSKRTPKPLQKTKSSFSTLSLIVLILILGGIGGGAFAARTQSQLPQNDRVHRTRIRAEFLSLSKEPDFRKALEHIQNSLAILPNSDKRASELRELRYIINQRAIARLRNDREKLIATPEKQRETLFTDLRRRYRGTSAQPLLEAIRLEAYGLGSTAFNQLADVGQQLFLKGLAQDALQAFKKCKELRNNSVIDAWLEKAQIAADNMVFVPKGRIDIGGKPLTIPAFYIDRYEVSQKRYKAFLDAQIELAKKDSGVDPKEHIPPSWTYQAKHAQLPMTNVSWENVSAYAKWANKTIPSTEQFTVAHKGPGQHTYPWGETPPVLYRACLAPFFSAKTPTGAFPSGTTITGIFDLAGNASEWCSKLEEQVIRGGSYKTQETEFSTFMSDEVTPPERAPNIGFRCVFKAALD